MQQVALVSGIRTPFAKAGTALSDLPAHELGRIAVQELLERTRTDPGSIDEVIFGNVAQPMEATNIARVIALTAGLPLSVSAHTVSRNCASGLQAIATGYDLIRSGRAHAVLVGGTESMSNIPLIFPKSMANFLGSLSAARSTGQKLAVLTRLRPSMFKPIIALLEGLKDPFCGLNMGETAEVLAKEFRISREAQDRFALESHQRAVAATESGRLAQEMTPVYWPKRRLLVEQDVGPRKGQTIEALAKLRPYFDRKHGTVTVGNSCPVTDGACAILLMSEQRVKETGATPLAFIRDYAFAGLDPRRMGLGPVASTTKVLRQAKLTLKDMDLLEINEAFAAQVLSVLKIFANPQIGETYGAGPELCEVDPSIVNVNGGAIALGHPVGTSGARIALTLAKELWLRQKTRGLATLCIGGGQGGAIVLERA